MALISESVGNAALESLRVLARFQQKVVPTEGPSGRRVNVLPTASITRGFERNKGRRKSSSLQAGPDFRRKGYRLHSHSVVLQGP